MSNNNTEGNTEKDNKLKSAQDNQNQVGDAESNPETSGPTDKVRESAYEDSDQEDKQNEPA
jgi:hypothetical protein